MEGGSFANFPVRYDGMDAARHEIELFALGTSLRGIAQIAALSGNYLVTGTYRKRMQGLDVRVLVGEPRANCFSLIAALQFAHQYAWMAQDVVTATEFVGLFFKWLIRRHSKSRSGGTMDPVTEKLIDALVQAQQGNRDVTMKTLDLLGDRLRKPLVEAVEPVGKSCSTVTFAGEAVVDLPTATAIRKEEADEVGEEQYWNVMITELNHKTLTCQVVIEGADLGKSVKGIITDPAAQAPNDPYSSAFAARTAIKVKGKATFKKGDVVGLYISDTAKP